MSIKAFFEKFRHADMHDPENRDLVLDYFVDKIYLYDDRVVITGKYDDNIEEGYLFAEEARSKAKKKGSPASCSGAFLLFFNIDKIVEAALGEPLPGELIGGENSFLGVLSSFKL